MKYTGVYALLLVLHLLTVAFAVGPVALAAVTSSRHARAGRADALRDAARSTRFHGIGTVITVLAAMPELLGRPIVGVQSLFMDMGTMPHRYSMSLNAARFLPGDANKWMLKFAALADPFFIWGIVLIGMGAYIIGLMEKEKAAVLAIVIALVSTLLFR